MDVEAADGARKQRRVAERERKRAVRACDSCRRQKEKCDGGVPCRRCVRLRKQCEFHGPAIPRPNPAHLPARSSAAGLDNPALTERLHYMERLLQHYAGDDIDLDPENIKRLAEAIDNEPAPSRPGQSTSQGSDYIGTDEEKFTVQPLGNNITHYSGEFSHWNFSMRIKQWIEQSMPEQARGENSATSFKEYYRPEELQSSSDAFLPLAALPPRHVADFLVNAFFTHAETNYFYVERLWLSRKIDIAYGNPASLTRRDVGTVCVIFIVLAIGTQYAYLDSPGQGEDRDPTVPFSEDAVGVMFYQQACKLIPDVIIVSSLESVQACLLIGIYTLPLDASGLSYIYLNLAVKLAIQNGMHRKYRGRDIDPVVKETRNKVWWTVYTTERRVGIFHGRPISIASADVDAEIPSDQHGEWPATSTTNIAAMLATLKLHKILSHISKEISVLKMHAKHGSFDTLSRLVGHKDELHQWWTELPDNVCRKDTSRLVSGTQQVVRSEIHLQLEYCLVRMFAGRWFIFMGNTSRSNSSALSSPAEQNPASRPRKTDHRGALVADCVEAALSVIEICKILRETIGLARASYTEFSACRAALLVIITQCLQDQTERLRQSLRDGVAMIKIMSAGGESARSEASLIEVFERAIARLDVAEDSNANSSHAESEYARFKKWERLWKNDSPSGMQAGGTHGSETILPDTPGPMAPPIIPNLWGEDSTGLDISQPAMTPAQQTMMPAGAATGAMDWTFASFPQNMDEFSSMFGYGYMSSPENMGGSAQGNNGDMWMAQ